MGKTAQSNKKQKINRLPISIFNRLQFITEFKEDSLESTAESILKTYKPVVLGSCGKSYAQPEKPLDVAAFKSSTILPGHIPYLKLPEIPQAVPPVSKKKRKIYGQPKFPSLIPLLMTANFSGTDIRRYHFVTQRNALRRMVTNDDKCVVNIVRFGSTLFLRRFSKHGTVNKNDVGYRFEEMCTTNGVSNVDFNILTDGRIGEYRILMMSETDAIDPVNGKSVELKSKKSNISKLEKHDWWLQAFLSGTETIIYGRRRPKDDSIVSELKRLKTSALSDRQNKIQTLNQLLSILKFLYSNVAAGRSYILRGCKDATTHQHTIKLYEIVDSGDKDKLTFITHELLEKFAVDE